MEARTFASLSSGLLARKGAAKPAMRPQGFGQLGANIDDLGWNDMGLAAPQPVSLAQVEERRPSPAPLTPPPVLRQQEELLANFTAPPARAIADPVELVPAAPETERVERGAEAAADVDVRRAEPAPLAHALPAPRARAAGKAKAAFTLRLDSERHLRLRLACAVANRSAQALVTAAVDAYLGGVPELEPLAAQLPAGAARA